MSITLNPELDRRVREKLATGLYESVDQLLFAALRALEEQERTIEAIAEGYEDFQAGRYETWEVADAEFRKKYGIPEA